MLWGKGFLNGRRTSSISFLKSITDFIFSVWAEEWGFVGCAVLLFLFCLLIFLTLRVARRSKDRYGSLNRGGDERIYPVAGAHQYRDVIGVLPVVGITLPFVSYGGRR